MYKKIIAIILFFSLLPLSVNAEWETGPCLIENWPPDVVRDYIKNIRIIIGNVSKDLSWGGKSGSFKKEFNRWTNRIMAIFNLSTSWWWYFSYFDFYITEPLVDDIPYEVMRDYDMIKNESKYIERHLRKIANQWYYDSEIKDLCKWIEWICNFSSNKASDIISELYTNNEKILEYYRLSILDNKARFSGELNLVPNNFKSEFNKYYNWSTWVSCSGNDGDGGFIWFFKKAWDQIKNIMNWQEMTKEWINEWQEWWNMLLWLDTQDQSYRELEEELLWQELRRQWLSIDSSEKVLGNLRKYNTCIDSDGATFAKCIWENISNRLNPFNESDIKDFNDALWAIEDWFDESMSFFTWENNTSTSLTIKWVSDTIWKNKTTDEIASYLRSTYESQESYIADPELNTQQLIWRLIKMHIDLVKTIEILDGTIEVSEEVCDRQGTGMGRCSY